jgi:two-component system, cell cycle response regulator DivK
MTELVVLYVEDEPKSRKILELLLTRTMKVPHVFLFEDSTDFIKRMDALTPQPTIVFLDIHVRPHSGFEMLTMLRDNPKYAHIPVVALTASVMNEEIQHLRQAGFNGCLAKPIDMEQFPNQVDRILNGDSIWYIST